MLKKKHHHLQHHHSQDALSTFTFDASPNLMDRDPYSIRVIDREGEPWFVAADVCKALGLTHTSNALKALSSDDIFKCNRITLGEKRGGHPMACVSESGLYKLVMRSDKPEARRFQDWVTRDVLPAIRKDGMYVKGEEELKKPGTSLADLDMAEMELRVLEALRSKVDRLAKENADLTYHNENQATVISTQGNTIAALEEDNNALEAVKAEMEPLVERYQAFLGTDGAMVLGETNGLLEP